MVSSGKAVAVVKDSDNGFKYGGRKSAKFVRCYFKEELGVFRVEVELHSELLRDISAAEDFTRLHQIIFPKHFSFVEFDFGRLKRFLETHDNDGYIDIEAEARRRAGSLRSLRSYLHSQGLVNFHRFLVPLPINAEIMRASKRWARNFMKDSR